MINQATPYMIVKRKKVALLFNLDFSSSMNGFRWNSLIMNAYKFVEQLTYGDLLACILFNHEVKILNQVYNEKRVIQSLGSLFQLLAALPGFIQENENGSESVVN